MTTTIQTIKQAVSITDQFKKDLISMNWIPFYNKYAIDRSNKVLVDALHAYLENISKPSFDVHVTSLKKILEAKKKYIGVNYSLDVSVNGVFYTCILFLHDDTDSNNACVSLASKGGGRECPKCNKVLGQKLWDLLQPQIKKVLKENGYEGSIQWTCNNNFTGGWDSFCWKESKQVNWDIVRRHANGNTLTAKMTIDCPIHGEFSYNYRDTAH